MFEAIDLDASAAFLKGPESSLSPGIFPTKSERVLNVLVPKLLATFEDSFVKF